MSIWKKIALVILAVILVIWGLYALPPTRGLVEDTFGPPLTEISGGVTTAIAESWVWQDYIAPFPNQMILLGFIFWVPFFWIFLRSRTKVRQIVQMGAAKDSGFSMPVSAPVTTVKSTTPAGATTRPAETTPTTIEVEKEETTA